VYAVSASGCCVSQMLIYFRKRMKGSVLYGALLNTFSVVKTNSGWILKCSVNGNVILSQL
jgi:hypothetical protein